MADRAVVVWALAESGQSSFAIMQVVHFFLSAALMHFCSTLLLKSAQPCNHVELLAFFGPFIDDKRHKIDPLCYIKMAIFSFINTVFSVNLAQERTESYVKSERDF